MKFLHPVGLWALLGIAVLIAFYLFREKYEEQTVSSTYLWRLSQKYLKKHLPIRRFKKILMAVLQVLTILCAALLIARPLISLQGNDREIVVLFDLSGSMRQTDEAGVSRFERAKEQLLEQVEALPAGSFVTVLGAGAQDTVLCPRTNAAADVVRAINQLKCGWGCDNWITIQARAQEILWEHPNTQVFVYSDLQILGEGFIAINVSGENEWNAAVTGFQAEKRDGKSLYSATVISDGKDSDLTAVLYLDDELKGAQTVHCLDGQESEVRWEQKGELKNARVLLTAEDGLPEDNERSCFPEPEGSVHVLLVSKQPFYLSSALKLFSSIRLETISSPEEKELTGYDLYVFDGCAPAAAPQDGSVWYFNPPALPSSAHIVLGDLLKGGRIAAVQERSQDAENILRDLTLQSVSAMQFREIRVQGADIPVFTCQDAPVMLIGREESGAARLTVTFDLHDSNLPLLADYMIWIRNMLAYSVQPLLPATALTVGETAYASAAPLTEKMYIRDAEGKVRTLTVEEGQSVFQVEKPGPYTLLNTRQGAEARYADFYVAFPQEESRLQGTAMTLSLIAGVQGENTEEQESYQDPVQLIGLLLLLLMILECVVYHHEQF